MARPPLAGHDLDGLYRRYGVALREAHDRLAGAGTPKPGGPAKSELEMLYLLVREQRPERVFEIGSMHGQSTSYVLQALHDNGFGHLRTIDVVHEQSLGVPVRLTGRWTFELGDVRRSGVPADVEFLVVNAAHSRTTTSWYLRCVLPFVPEDAMVALRDADCYRFPSPRRERACLAAWLDEHDAPRFTVAESGSWFGSGSRSPLVFFRNPANGLPLRTVRREALAGDRSPTVR